MTRVGVLVVLAVLAVLLAGCDGSGAGGDAVLEPQFSAAATTPVPGPAYVESRYGRKGRTIVHTPAHTTRLASTPDVVWRADGRVIVADTRGARLLDPATGRWLSARVPLSEYGVTPAAFTTLRWNHPDRVVVYDAELRERRSITVPESAAETDQLGGDAEFQLHGRPYTLGEVTFVEWGVNSEDDTRTDHGLFRIEGEEITQALRNEPLVRLWPSTDGSALLAIMQDNGEDEDCGGCQVEQKVVELDPATGEIGADYGTPPGYTRDWRISALDKIGSQVVVQYVVRAGESGGAYQTWSYDGSWARVEEAGDTRTRFQQGGAIAWSGDTGEESRPFDLTWTPTDGAVEVLRDRGTPCPEDRTGFRSCPAISLPGSLLPLG